MELELGLAPPNACGKKRGFGEAFEFESEEEKTTLPLFDDGSSSGCMKKKAVVGWPPVSSARKICGGRHVKVKKEGVAIVRKVDLSLHASYDDLLATLRRMFSRAAASDEEEITNDHHGGRCAAVGDRVVVVTYEDADGDWMLVGDVPWDDFARSVKRLKILL